jgi:hypothetical protein
VEESGQGELKSRKNDRIHDISSLLPPGGPEDYVSGFGENKGLPFETEKAIKTFAVGPAGRQVGM